EHNSKHVLVKKVINPRKFEIVAEAHQVKKEGIAAAASKEGVITGIRDLRLLPKRNGSIGNDDLAAIIIACCLLARCLAYCRRLVPILVGRKGHAKRDFGYRITICINPELIDGGRVE